MRASSLSNSKVIGLLNSSFIPVNVSNEAYGERGNAPVDEKAAMTRIYRDALAAGLHAGSVCIYLVSPEGRPIAVAPLNEDIATDPDRLAKLMEGVVRELGVVKGDAVIAPRSQEAGPTALPESLVIRVVARYLERRGDDCAPFDVRGVLGTARGGNWSNLPSEGWIVIERADWMRLLPPGESVMDTRYRPDMEVLRGVLHHFYPPTENTDLRKNRIDDIVIQARIEAIEGGVARARIEGRMKMKHPFYHQDDNNFVEAKLIGFLEFATDKSSVRSLRMVTDDALYGGNVNGVQPFGAAARSVGPTN